LVSDEHTLPWLGCIREEVPALELLDVHTHIGSNDPDEYRSSPDELLGALELAGARAAVFPMHEPGGYGPANDMVMAEAAASGGVLTAFCRLDPEHDALAEAERCLDAGARGIKLHPRAEGFTLDHPALRGVFVLADERRLPVLVHAGRGIPALGRHAVELTGRHPGLRLILAHAGISDLSWIWRVAAEERPNLFFDSAWWTPSDLLALFSLVPPGQVLFGSDAPYATPVFSAATALRCALQAGLSEDQMRSVAGGQARRLIAGEDPLDLGPAPGAGELSNDPLLDRVYGFLVTSIGQMLRGFEPEETLQLAALACDVGDDAPQAPVCRSVLALLEARSRYEPRPGERPPRFAPGLHLIVMAATACRTPNVRLPSVSPEATRVVRLSGPPESSDGPQGTPDDDGGPASYSSGSSAKISNPRGG
jgi:predicted TIM-barrel fold metal-dependent hydrolase